MPPNATAAELQKLAERLYGGDLPGMTGDIPLIRSDVHAIKGTVDDLAGFYRTMKRIVLVGASLSTLLAGVATIISIAF
jgi:hypothetical protein